MSENGFSAKPVLEGTGAAAGEAYAWAIDNPSKVSCIVGENPVIRSLMTKSPPMEHLDVLAHGGVALIHECGENDPWLESQTREVEKRCQGLGGQITVVVRSGCGHFLPPGRDVQSIVDFVLTQSGKN